MRRGHDPRLRGRRRDRANAVAHVDTDRYDREDIGALAMLPKSPRGADAHADRPLSASPDLGSRTSS